MKQSKKFVVSAMVAAAAGYIAGILTAPKSGKETRQDVKNAAIKTKHEAEKKLKELHSELDKLLVQAKAQAKKLKKSAADEFNNAVAKAQFAKQKAREVLSAIHEGDATDQDLQDALAQAKQATDSLKTFLKKNTEENKKA